MTTAWTHARWIRKDAEASQANCPGGRSGDHPLLAQLLAARGIVGNDATQRFLHPKLTDLHDPARLPGCIRAAKRLKQAVDDHQLIVIYGDYDVDGVTASAILYHTLALAGANVLTYVPHRLDEGYGLNEDAIRAISDGDFRLVDREARDDAGATPAVDPPSPIAHPPLIVSVDCGITATGPAQVARELGLDLIITDHHQFDPDDLPDAHTLVHPGLAMADGGLRISEGNADTNTDQDAPGNPPSEIHHPPSPNLDLCGAGVAYKLAWQFAREFSGCAATDAKPAGKLPDKFRVLLMDLLALAALGTVADVVPLVGENRVITCFGLSRIKKTGIAGLNALIEASNLAGEKIDSYHVGFVLGPRLNACGRMGHAREAVEILTTAQGERAKELAEELHQANEQRRATERRIVDAAVEQVETHGYHADDRRAIVVAGEGWHPGVVGIVASRLVDRYLRPAVVLGIDTAAGEAKGSARSVDGVSIHAALTSCGEHLAKFGGHAMAAGLTMDAAKLDVFREDLVAAVNKMLAAEDLCESVRIDATVDLCDCGVVLFDDLQRLAPFGRSNPKPRLLTERVTLARAAHRMGAAGKHLSLQLRQGGASIRAVAWNRGDLADDLPAGVSVDIVFQPSINTWQGRRSAELHVVDLRIV
ncbi:MAG: DHHA1 domain-containing protein [Planctomycetota bacterium]